MMRYLPWLILVVLVILALKKRAAPKVDVPRAATDELGGATASGESNRSAQGSEQMVSCAQCEVYFPASEAVHRGGQVYCGSAHADLS